MVRLVLEQGYRASDATQASTALQAVLGVGTATVESLGSLRYDQWSLVDDGISVTRIESSGALMHVHATPSPDMLVLAVRSGYTVLKHGAETVALEAGDLGLVPLEQAVRTSWEQVTMDLYSFPRSSLNHLLRPDTEKVALRVERFKAVSPAVIDFWMRTADALGEGVLRNPELAESDVIREQAIEALLGLTIEAFGIVDADEDDSDDRTTLERATTVMRRDLARSISVTDIAREVGVSIRRLQLVFQRAGHGTPLAHLRALRMSAAQQALTTATAPTTVHEVARSVGYFNIGRFDTHYFDAFDRLPEEDLNTATEAARVPD